MGLQALLPDNGTCCLIRRLRLEGQLVFHIFSALAQFERRLIQERTQAGLAAARARGRRGGRRALQPGDPQVQLAYTMYADHHWTVDELCATLRISRATCYRYVALARRAVPKE